MYAICILIGICVAVWILTTRWKRYGGTFDQILDTTLVTVPLRSGGRTPLPLHHHAGRLLPPTGNLINILKVWEGGMAIFGVSPWARWWRSCGAATSITVSRSSPTPSLAAPGPGHRPTRQLVQPGTRRVAPPPCLEGLKLNDADAIGKSEICYSGAECPDYKTTLFHPTFL